MALIGKNTEEKIWNFLTGKGLSAHGAAGLMGNLYAESALDPMNLQNTYEKSLGYTDAGYTAAVDSGKSCKRQLYKTGRCRCLLRKENRKYGGILV